MSEDGSVRTRAWPKYLRRGLGLFAVGFALAWVGYWVELPWVQWLAFGIGVIGQLHLTIALAYAAQRWWGGSFAWYHEAYQRNVRAAERQAAGESATPRRPNDR